MAGILYLVATPIGNLGDFTPRAVETLENADFIAAEDTRVSMKLLNHFGVKKPLISYHEHNHITAGQSVLNRLLAGESCALMTDAGTPRHLRPRRGSGAAVRRKRRGGPGHPRLLRRRQRLGRQRSAHRTLHL